VANRSVQWYHKRGMYFRGLEIECGITNLQSMGDHMECGSYRGIKLLEHAMKVVEGVFEHRIRHQTDDVVWFHEG